MALIFASLRLSPPPNRLSALRCEKGRLQVGDVDHPADENPRYPGSVKGTGVFGWNAKLVARGRHGFSAFHKQ
ncbi:MAG: hypothetical protein ISN26_03385 [Betaproteobacteria bacterium AqS2]|uniref:Uncharacterized protein n=1 Tax=Candidatus Amphirhobacter heronislandensis TaxID=1732024 RepID=A0A930Y194_9GAMM|nr:hypothetical protein [Betaproteobacteria bacterium AqS2]